MMASRAACFFVLSICSNAVVAWQSSSRMAANTVSPRTINSNNIIGTTGDPEILPSSSRREMLFLIPKMAAIVATSTVMLPHRVSAAAPPSGIITADSARSQWRNSATILDDLLQNWSTEKWAEEVGGGDNIRTVLGTQGTTSPLFQIEKAFKVLRDSEYVDDFVEFQEITVEFMDALFVADSLAASSNNKTGSGKQTPPEIFIEQSKAEVVKMQSIAKKMNEMVK